MNLIIQPYRYALAVAVVAAGFLLMETAPLFWPPIYQNARAAILVMFLGFALLTLAGDTQGRIRSASGLAVSFQEVVHSERIEETGVTTPQ